MFTTFSIVDYESDPPAKRWITFETPGRRLKEDAPSATRTCDEEESQEEIVFGYLWCAFKNAPGDRTPDRLRIVFSALDPRDERFVLRIQNEWHMIFQSPRGFSAAPEQGTITFVVVEGASEALGRPRDIAYQSMRQTILKQCRVGRSKNKEILIRLKFEQPNFVGYVHDYLREMFAEGTPLRHFLPEAIEHFLGESDDDTSLQRSND